MVNQQKVHDSYALSFSYTLMNHTNHGYGFSSYISKNKVGVNVFVFF